MQADDLQLPWRPRTRQEQGHDTEARLLRQHHARPHPRSGAGRIKYDGSRGEGRYDPDDAI